MMGKLYLLINIGTIIFPLMLSFDKKVHYYKKWKFLFPAIALTAIPFIIWDMVFTAHGVWGFNATYLTGVSIGNLPIEEVLFFITVPYASVFIYECFICYTKKEWLRQDLQRLDAIIFSILCLAISVLFADQAYTSITFLSLGVFILILALLRKRFLSAFFISYCIIAIPFFLVNGILTGSWIPDEIVWYNDAEHLGIRIATIPIVDFFYGMLLMIMNVAIYEHLRSRAERRGVEN